MTTIVGGICPRCGQFHDLFLAVDGSIVCRNADGTAERIRQLEAERDAARAEVAALRKQEWAAPYRREVLADLRAKVESVPRIAAVSRGTGAYVPCVQLSDVLALLDEVQP